MRAANGNSTHGQERTPVEARCRSKCQGSLLSPAEFFPQRRLFESPLLASSTLLHSSTKMASKQAKSENQQSLKVLEELLAKLNVSKAQDEINGVSQEIAIFINGDIEEEDAPTK